MGPKLLFVRPCPKACETTVKQCLYHSDHDSLIARLWKDDTIMQDEMLSEPSQQQPKPKVDQVKSQSIF